MAGAFSLHGDERAEENLETVPTVWPCLLSRWLVPGLHRFLRGKPRETDWQSQKGNLRPLQLPLIMGVALLCFAHGANDVADTVGPLAAIVSTFSGDEIAVGLESRSG